MNVYLFITFAVLATWAQRGLCSDGNYFYYTFTEKDNGPLQIGRSNRMLNTVDVKTWTAQAFYNASQNHTGWDVLQVESNPDLDDEVQAYHAGYVEGYATRDQIWNYYYNILEGMVSNASDIRNNITREYIQLNNDFVRSKNNMVEDPYWHHVKLFYIQVEGLTDGYNNATKAQKITGQELTFHHFLLMNFFEELIDLEVAYIKEHQNGTKQHEGKRHRRASNGAHCSALIKLLPGNSDVFVAHDTWSGYDHMNRILKRYKLAFKMSKNDSRLIPGMSVAFSSYPGTIGSVDDFYIMGSGLITLETTNEVYNLSLYLNINPNNEVSEAVRNIVANRLANDGLSWMKYFSRDNSGTYNNQWMIVDMNKFKPGFDPKEGFLTILEQAPGLIVPDVSTNKTLNPGDQTAHLLMHSYWASYNIPFYAEMYNITGNVEAAKNNSWYSYTDCPRAKIFKREQSKVIDMDTMIRLMRYNNYKKDPYSRCDVCNPQPNACNAISSRCDLNPTSGKYGLLGVMPNLFGATDMKLTSFSLFREGKMVAIGGPTSDGLEPFSWKTTRLNKTKVRHLGQPETFNFKPLVTSWIISNSNINGDSPLEPTPAPEPKKKANSSSAIQPFSIIAYILLSIHLIIKGVF